MYIGINAEHCLKIYSLGQVMMLPGAATGASFNLKHSKDGKAEHFIRGNFQHYRPVQAGPDGVDKAFVSAS